MFYDIPERQLEPPEPPNIVICCPVCGSRNCDYIVLDKDKNAVGCDNCTKSIDVWEYGQ